MIKKRFFKIENLTILALIAGIFVGVFFPGVALSVSFLGELFVTLLKMIILPLIFISIFLAIARQGSASGGLTRIGSMAFFYFVGTGFLAVLTGMMASFLLPASGEIASLSFEKYDPSKIEGLSFQKFFLSFFTSNPFQSFADGQILQVVVFSIFLGCASLSLTPPKKEKLLIFFDISNDLVMTLIRWILFYAPIGVFSLLAALIAQTDASAFLGLGWFFIAVTCAACTHVFITLPFIGFFLGKFHPYRFIWNVREALVVALSTASSAATLPVSTRVLEVNEKVRERTTGFVLPLGATLNMDGSGLYQTLVILFLGTMAGIDFSISQKLLVFLFVMFSSAGTAGIPGGGLIVVGALLQMLGIPLEYLGIYVLVDRFWDPLITSVNVLGDLFGAKIIDQNLS